jgi:TonB family protein
MIEFIQINLLLLFMYAIYILVFKHKQGAKHNRLFLLFGIGFSVFVPWINISFSSAIDSASTMAITQVLPAMVVYTTDAISINWFSVMLIAYTLVVTYMLGALILAFFKMKKLVEQPLGKYAGYNLYLTKPGHDVFSFYKSIYIDAKDTNNLILDHEVAHLKQLHYIDNLIVELVSILFWMNPAAWLLRKEVKENLEYAADLTVVNSRQEEALAYIQLIATGTQSYRPVLASNFFNQSLTYQRCKKLLNANQFKFNTMRNIAILPLIAVLTYFTACDKPTEPIEKKVEIERNLGDPVSEEEVITFPGGDAALIDYLAENTQYPQSAKKSGVEGKSMVSFRIDRDGNVNSVETLESSGNEDLDTEAMRVISEMPQWDSKVKDENEEVEMELVIPIVFKLGEEK